MSLSPEYQAHMGHPEAEQYAELQRRCDATIADAKVCMGQALNAGDIETVKDMRIIIENIELQKLTMRKPGEAPRPTS